MNRLPFTGELVKLPDGSENIVTSTHVGGITLFEAPTNDGSHPHDAGWFTLLGDVNTTSFLRQLQLLGKCNLTVHPRTNNWLINGLSSL